MVKNLVFLSGWSFMPGVWHKQKDHFSALGFNVTLCGLSRINSCLKTLDLSRTIFIAWSLGWFKLVEALYKAQKLPQAIVAVSAGIRFQNSLMRLMLNKFKSDNAKFLGDFNSWLFSDNEKREDGFALRHDFIRRHQITKIPELTEDLLYLKEIDLSRYLTCLTLPVLLISGRHDIISSPCGSERLSRCLRSYRFELMDSGHIPFLTQENDFNRLVSDFIREQL